MLYSHLLPYPLANCGGIAPFIATSKYGHSLSLLMESCAGDIHLALPPTQSLFLSSQKALV